MNRMVEVPEEVYEKISAQAEAEGVSVIAMVCELVAAGVDRAKGREAMFEQLRRQGTLVTFECPTTPELAEFEPVDVKGKPLSEIIIADRR